MDTDVRHPEPNEIADAVTLKGATLIASNKIRLAGAIDAARYLALDNQNEADVYNKIVCEYAKGRSSE